MRAPSVRTISVSSIDELAAVARALRDHRIQVCELVAQGSPHAQILGKQEQAAELIRRLLGGLASLCDVHIAPWLEHIESVAHQIAAHHGASLQVMTHAADGYLGQRTAASLAELVISLVRETLRELVRTQQDPQTPTTEPSSLTMVTRVHRGVLTLLVEVDQPVPHAAIDRLFLDAAAFNARPLIRPHTAGRTSVVIEIPTRESPPVQRRS